MSSRCVHRFAYLLGMGAALSLTGVGLTSCAAWFQGESAQEQINVGGDEVIEAQRPENSAQTLGDLTPFINSTQAAEMLNTEPLQTRVAALVENNQDWFNASREVLLPVTQIMQGYILSEGHSATQDKRSLILIDPDRDALMVVLVDMAANTYKMLEKVSEKSDPQAAAEMEEYADNWGLGQLGMAE
jgi:hypothetical protein